MITELEELVGFLGSPKPQIRQIALENLEGFSKGPQSNIFTPPPDLQPIRNLKTIVADIPPRAKHALTILVNLCDNREVLSNLENDDAFLELLLSKITTRTYPNADQVAMLLANMTKSDKVGRLIGLQRSVPAPEDGVSSSAYAMDQLMDCFVKGASRGLNSEADYDFLAYVFADLSRMVEGRRYFTTKRDYDNVIPISKLVVFTQHQSLIRRNGVASTIKNCCFDVASHRTFLDPDKVGLLPFILLPIMGPEEYSEEDMDGMPEDLQLLPPDKEREPDTSIILTHLESLLLLTTTRYGREQLRSSKVYPIIRETHLHVQNDDVEDACDRIVQVLMRDEVPEDEEEEKKILEAVDEDDEIVEIL